MRRDIEQKIRADREQLATAFWVKFKVVQSDLAADFADYVHVAGFSHTPAKVWFGEHAHALGGKSFDYTSLVGARTNGKFSAKIADGECCYHQMREAEMINVYRGSVDNFSNQLLPEEDLYREIIGMESRRQDVGTTFKGYRKTESYDIFQIAGDKAFSFEKTDANTYRFSKPKVQNIWVDASKGYAVVRIERFAGGVPVATIENSQFEFVESKLWLPRKSSITYYNTAGVQAAKATLQVQGLSLSPRPELFKPQLDKFAGLCDVGNGFNPVKMRPLQGKKMVEFLDRAPKLAQPVANVAPPTRSFGKLLTWAIGIVLLVSGLIVYWKTKPTSSRR